MERSGIWIERDRQGGRANRFRIFRPSPTDEEGAVTKVRLRNLQMRPSPGNVESADGNGAISGGKPRPLRVGDGVRDRK
ncbi:hypothetical protein chiPu_0024326 [Chiloscyllium punctatum]|uniref:Uncharacterized protein n=1 Tax=Chiloscyllium punctatum TaxID=137246 RepID=A0A401TCH6_CHIPU|nr:hypothetical protein [Chiloscyllium punctatum]